MQNKKTLPNSQINLYHSFPLPLEAPYEIYFPSAYIWNLFSQCLVVLWNEYTVDSRYLDFGYLEQPLISKKKSGPCLNIEI